MSEPKKLKVGNWVVLNFEAALCLGAVFEHGKQPHAVAVLWNFAMEKAPNFATLIKGHELSDYIGFQDNPGPAPGTHARMYWFAKEDNREPNVSAAVPQ